MWLAKRTDKDGDYYSFSYFDQVEGKRRRLPKERAPHFDNYDEALSWAKQQEAFKEHQNHIIELRRSNGIFIFTSR